MTLHRSLLVAPILTLALAGPAAAQPAAAPAGPGACTCAVPVVVAAPAPAPAPLPRWSVGLRLDSIGLAPADAPDVEPTPYQGSALELRYRVRPRWELAASVGGARNHDTDERLATLLLDVRFHPWPRAAWDAYALVGVGGAALAADGAEEPAGRGAFAVGAGVAHAVGPVSLALELRALALGAPEERDAMATAAIVPGASTPDERTGAALSLGVSYGF